MQQTITNYIAAELLDQSLSLDLSPSDDLLGVGMLSSMQFLRLIQFIESEFNLVVPPEDMLLENFQTVEAICTYLNMRQGATS